MFLPYFHLCHQNHHLARYNPVMKHRLSLRHQLQHLLRGSVVRLIFYSSSCFSAARPYITPQSTILNTRGSPAQNFWAMKLTLKSTWTVTNWERKHIMLVKLVQFHCRLRGLPNALYRTKFHMVWQVILVKFVDLISRLMAFRSGLIWRSSRCGSPLGLSTNTCYSLAITY